MGASLAINFVLNRRRMPTTARRGKSWLIAVVGGRVEASSSVPPKPNARDVHRRSVARLDPIVGLLCMSKNRSGRPYAHWSERPPTSFRGRDVTGSKHCLQNSSSVYVLGGC